MAQNRIRTVEESRYPYIFIKNQDIPLKTYQDGLIRCNLYLPKDAAPYGKEQYPVIATYGPYGKDLWYKDFHARAFSQINDEMKSEHSAWETPDPAWWTKRGYAIVRCDERGSGQSPGLLDTMSAGTSEAFFDVVEWCAEQEWSTGKVGLLGVSYYAGTQWRVAARRPKGLAAIIPWEGMSDYYRDRVRHGGILSNQFISFWWNNSVLRNQYGLPGRAAKGHGDDTIEGDLSPEALLQNRRDQTVDTAVHKYMDDEYYASRNFDCGQIEVPVLSVGNWGGILLHLRGNVIGWLKASSKHKFLRFIVGRHDLPFYYPESAKMQLSFFDSFMKGDDYDGWQVGRQPRVRYCIREGDCGVDDPKRELAFPVREDIDWPLPGTQYTKFFLHGDKKLSTTPVEESASFEYDAMSGDPIQFRYKSISRLEVTGHPVVHLTVSCGASKPGKAAPTDIDLFITLRKFSASGEEVYFTGTMGDPVPIVKGWLRASLRKVDTDNSFHREWLMYRSYFESDLLSIIGGEKYEVDIEVWPTSVVLSEGEELVLEIAGHDTQGVGVFGHTHEEDRSPAVFEGLNTVHVGGEQSFLTLPIIP